MADPVNTGFDTEFSDPLAKFRAALAAQGIGTNLFSGVRDNAKQAKLYANYLAGRSGQPLPYPELGRVPLAAPPGTSLHERGLAADIRPTNPADLPRMRGLAGQYGLQTLQNDPYHFQLADWRQAEASQPPNSPWSTLADLPSQMASNVDSSSAYAGATPSAPAVAAINASAPPGMNINSIPAPDRLASMVGTLESGGGRFSSAQPASMVDPFYGQYPGFAKSYGRGAAGIDNYAQAVLATNPKASVGDFYAGYFSGTGTPGSPNFNSFDRLSKGAIQDTPGSPAAQRAAAANFTKNAGVDPSTPLASVIGAPAPQPPVEGATGAIDPSIMARQSTTPVYTAPPTIASQIAGPLQALTKNLEDSGKQQQQGGGDQGAQLQAQQAAAGYGMQRQQMLQQMGAQLLAATLAQGQKPLSWNSRPPGSEAGLQIMVPQTPTPGGGFVGGGTTLNSMGDPYYG